MEHLRTPGHGDLRIRITPDPKLEDHELFDSMPLGDTWSDADLKPCWDYLIAWLQTHEDRLS